MIRSLVSNAENSYELQKRAFYSMNAGKYIVTSAWGSWAEWVPEGFVGVCSYVGGHERARTDTTPPAFFLVPADEYKARDGFGFVIDEDKHQHIGCQH